MSDSERQRSPAAQMPSSAQSALSRFSLNAVLPDRKSRLVFVPVFLLLVAGFIFWLQWIIVTRWQAQVRHPTVQVTTERLSTVPAMQAFGIQFPKQIFDMASWKNVSGPPNALAHYVLPETPQYVRTVGPRGGVNCSMIDPRNLLLICQPTQDGKRVYGNDPNAPFPDLTDHEVWDWQLASAQDAICLDVFSFVRLSPIYEAYNMSSMPFNRPYLATHLVTPPQIVHINQFIDGVIDFNLFDFQTLLEDDANAALYDYDRYHHIAYTVSKYSTSKGRVTLTYEQSDRDALEFSPEQKQQYLETQLLALRPELRSQVEAWEQDPDVGWYVINLCLGPSTMKAIVSTEHVEYGPLPFFSDLGGFLNLAMLILTLSFPIIARVKSPRKFILFLLLGSDDKGLSETSTLPVHTCTNCGHVEPTSHAESSALSLKEVSLQPTHRANSELRTSINGGHLRSDEEDVITQSHL